MIKVCVWRPQGTSGVGHSSIWMSNGSYISFWPSGDISKKAKSGSYSSKAMMSYDEDVSALGRKADYVQELRNLNESAIYRHWSNVRTRPYNLKKDNCSSVVMGCLYAGSGIAKPGANIFYKNSLSGIVADVTGCWHPEDVVIYAENLKREVG